MVSAPLTQPNFYQLSGHHIHVSYYPHFGPATSEFPEGPPIFTYQDPTEARSFSGSEVQIVDTLAGQLVSVTIHLTVDTGSTTFSVLIPRVNLVAGHPAPIHTEGITAIHRIFVAALGPGQQDSYTVTPLHGTASEVIVPV